MEFETLKLRDHSIDLLELWRPNYATLSLRNFFYDVSKSGKHKPMKKSMGIKCEILGEIISIIVGGPLSQMGGNDIFK
jgi:hypothetical protein